MLSRLLNMIVSFGSKTEYVRHEAHFNVAAKDAWQICQDYAEFIKVMLRDQKDPPNPQWIKGGPGEVGGEVQYDLEREGSKNTIVERVVELSADEETGTYTLAWEQTMSDPPLPLKGYGCTWVLKGAGPDAASPCCHLVWTRHFKEPKALGLVSLAGFMKNSFRRTAGPIMDWIFRQYYAAQFPPPDRRLPKPGERVVVVGAGPSGLHMAHLLRQELGIEDITILERTDRYGGKTLTIKDQTQEGIVHELGTCYLHPAYFAVRTLVNQLKGMLGSEVGQFGKEVAPIHYSIARLGQGTNLDLDEWVTSNLQVQPRFSLMALWRILLPKADTAVEVILATETYKRLHEQYLGRYDYSMPPRPCAEALKEIDMSFGQYLENNGMSALMPLLAYGQTAQGYGSIENTPTFWALCWITPQLLDGYLRAEADPHLPPEKAAKAMFRFGWESLWDTIIKVNQFDVRYETMIKSIERPEGDDLIVVTSTQGEDGPESREEFDYIVVAAPLVNPDPKGKVVPLDMRDDERALLGGANTSSSQFRTNLFKLEQPQPYLYAHLDLDSDRVLGPGTGKGDVFASRDSYLALNPQYCKFDAHQDDPVRGQLREQMSYQWVEDDKHLPLEDLDSKFDEWAVGRFGSDKNYKMLKNKTWTYFQRFDRNGLREQEPWKVLELQGRRRTLFVHASNFFESVLDIVNYNNMLVDGLSGKLNDLSHPKSDTKPLYYESIHWKLIYNRFTKFFLTCLDLVLGTIWTLLYIPIRPLLAFTVIRWLRYKLQVQFKTENPGKWWQYSMSKFIKISPSVICFFNGKEDPIVTLSKETLRKEHPEIPIVDKALKWSYHDYRTVMPVWMKLLKPDFLTFIGPRLMSLFRRARSIFPVAYNYVMSWGFCVAFNQLTGYSVRIEDDKGGGCYVPRCHMLRVAQKEYGEVVGSRICTHVCKIFTEEAMKMRGLDCVLEPCQEKGSCMIRGVPYQKPAYADHSADCELSIPSTEEAG